jgi:dipeptidyl aminopeptidase/acylaminoacyl peptidase
MRKTISSIIAIILGVACGGTSPPAIAIPSVAPAERVTTPLAPDAAPTVRTAEQRARDDARSGLANAILDAYGNYSPRFSHDRKQVLFASNRDGNRQYYLADVLHPSVPPVALTHGPERAAGGVLTRDGRSALFLRDVGADENYRIFKVDLDGKNEKCLTPGPVLRRSPPIEPTGKPGTIVYWQRDVKSPQTGVVVHAIEGDPKVVYTDPSPTTIADVTGDARHALLLRRYSSSDYVLFDLDLGEKSELRRLYPPDGRKASVHGAAYSPDGKRAYVGADDGAAGEFLYVIDVKSAKIAGEYRQSEPETASVASVSVSPRGDRVAIVVDAGDHAEARILDAKSLRIERRVDAPLGSITLTSFSDDGSRIAAALSTPETPPDIVAIDPATGAIEPLRDDKRSGLDQLEAMETSVVTVRAFDGLAIPIIVHRRKTPSGQPASEKRVPVIVAFHGGPADSASVGWDGFARFFTALGYAYVEPNVRGSTGYGHAFEMADNREKRKDWLKDLETVNAWTRSQSWADSTRIVAMGGSYGGYTVLMALSRQPTLWRAGVEYVGIANLLTFLKSTSQWLRAVWVDEFGDLDKDVPLLTEFSPLHEVDHIVAPLYVYAGQNDPRVPREESDQVVLALRRRDVPVEYQVATNEGHSLAHRENRVEFMTRVARFLEDNLQ